MPTTGLDVQAVNLKKKASSIMNWCEVKIFCTSLFFIGIIIAVIGHYRNRIRRLEYSDIRYKFVGQTNEELFRIQEACNNKTPIIGA